MFETVFFDAAGTLIQLRRPVVELYLEHAQDFGFQAYRAERIVTELSDAYRKTFRESPPLCFPGRERKERLELERRWWRRVVTETFDGLGRFDRLDEYFDFIYRWFGSCLAWRLEESCRETLLRLKQAGKRLGIISNFDTRLYRLLSELKIGQLFDCVVVSSEAPSAKPDPSIFGAALSRAGADRASSVHVGDHYEYDFQGARRAGIASLLYDPQGRFPHLPEQERVDELGKLCRVLL